MGRRRRSRGAGMEEAGSHPSGVEAVGTKRCGRGGQDVGVKETEPSHSDNVGSGVEWSGANTGEGKRPSASLARNTSK